jgi:hypothetical protein
MLINYFAQSLSVDLLRNFDLSKPGEVHEMIKNFKFLDRISVSYSAVLSHPRIGMSALTTKKIKEKITNTVYVVGHARLANGIVLKNYDQSYRSESASNDLKKAFRDHILLQEGPIETSTKTLRSLLRILSSFCAQRNLELLECMWRETLTSYLCDQMQRMVFQLTRRDFSDTECVIRLQVLLQSTRKLCKLDMSALPICGSSAESAFEDAFKRLPQNSILLLTKVLVVYCSSLIDSLKCQQQVGEWSESVDSIVNLLQVLYVVILLYLFAIIDKFPFLLICD